jgi:hypothetical protein
VLPRLVIVADPVASPAILITGSLTLNVNVFKISSYDTVKPECVAATTIACAASCTASVKSVMLVDTWLCELSATVVVIVALARLVTVPVPLTSPSKVNVKSPTLKFNFPVVSS